MCVCDDDDDDDDVCVSVGNQRLHGTVSRSLSFVVMCQKGSYMQEETNDEN